MATMEAGYVAGYVPPAGGGAGTGGGTTTQPVKPPAADKVVKGSMLAAPNALDVENPASKVVFTFKGTADGVVEIDIFDEARSFLGTLKGSCDASGIGTVSILGAGVNGRRLGVGVYWAVARGGGVKDVRPFAVVRKKR